MPNPSLSTLVEPFTSLDTNVWEVVGGGASLTTAAGRLRGTGASAGTSTKTIRTQTAYDAGVSTVYARLRPSGVAGSTAIIETLDANGRGVFFGTTYKVNFGTQCIAYGRTSGGVRNQYVAIDYVATAHAWMRQRWLANDLVYYDVAPDDGGAPGTWTQLGPVYYLDTGAASADRASVRLTCEVGQYYSSSVTYGEIDAINTTVPVVTVTVTPDAATLEVGGQTTLTATVTGGTEGVTWSSSNPSVATVSSMGGVTAVAPGSATITATYVASDAMDTCAIAIPAIAIDTSPVDFSAPLGGEDPEPIVREIENGGGGTLADPTSTVTWGADEPEDWMDAVVIHPTGEPPQLVLTPSLTGLVARIYHATVTLTASHAVDVEIPVTLRVEPVDETEVLHATPYDTNDQALSPWSVQYSVEPQDVVSVDAAVTLRAIKPVLEATPVTLTVTINGQTTSSVFTVYPHDS